MELHHLRQEYARQGLDLPELSPDPFVQFAQWFRQAQEAGISEPNAMSLATASASGAPAVRTVLLKAFDASGFVFFTNYESRKARELAENPRASLLFPWIGLERQVIVTGRVEKISREATRDYFRTRPYGNRLGALASPQSRVVPSRAFLEENYEALKRRFPEGSEVPVPESWGGYRVVPETVEFWQGRPSRMHDRLVYVKSGETAWRIERLAP